LKGTVYICDNCGEPLFKNNNDAFITKSSVIDSEGELTNLYRFKAEMGYFTNWDMCLAEIHFCSDCVNSFVSKENIIKDYLEGETYEEH